MAQNKIIVVGGGQAAVQLCLALRKAKVTSPVLILTEEAVHPYNRPPLSKSFLTGETEKEKLSMRPLSFYASKDVEVALDTRVVSIDPQAHTVHTETGSHEYSSLLIATGARPRPLPVPGASLGGVHFLRDLDHSVAIRSELQNARNIGVIGAGFIGLEFAAVANQLNKRVTVFDTADRVMARAVSPVTSRWFERTHRSDGIDLRLNESVSAVIGADNVEQIQTASGEILDCDLLVIGIGVIPNDEIASAAGLACDDGVIVNEFCETSVSNIYSAGDCARHPNPFASGSMVRLESIQNATDQARVVARAIAGDKMPYHAPPWFWSDQGEHSLQMAGFPDAAAEFVTRGNPADDAFSVFHCLNGSLQCVDSVNSPREHIIARKLIAAGINPSPEQIANTDFDLKDLI